MSTKLVASTPDASSRHFGPGQGNETNGKHFSTSPVGAGCWIVVSNTVLDGAFLKMVREVRPCRVKGAAHDAAAVPKNWLDFSALWKFHLVGPGGKQNYCRQNLQRFWHCWLLLCLVSDTSLLNWQDLILSSSLKSPSAFLLQYLFLCLFGELW